MKIFYGTSLKHTQNALDNGKIVVFDIDVQGFKIARKKWLIRLFLFLLLQKIKMS